MLRLWKLDQAELILHFDIDLIRLIDGVRTCRRLPDQPPDFNDEGAMAMIRIAHVSDLHLHCRKQDNKKALALLERVRQVSSSTPATNYTLITGDITDDGDPGQYRQALAALQPFIGHLLLAPGNHDYGPLGSIYLKENAKAFDKLLLHGVGIQQIYFNKQPLVDLLDDGSGTQVLAVGLNSVSETVSPWDFARGNIGEEQLSALHTILSNPAYATAHKLVYLHHRPLKCHDWFLELVDAEDLMAILHQQGVTVAAFGHTGGSLQEHEPPQARIVRVLVRTYGVPYLLNANQSVAAQKFNEMVFDGQQITVRTV